MGDDTVNAVFNGIDGTTGHYLIPPRSVHDIADVGRGVIAKVDLIPESFGLPATVDDPQDLAQAGWGIVVPPALDPAIRAALEPLLARRRAEAGSLYRELVYEPGTDPFDWLAAQGVAVGAPEPAKVPYYLLLVGPPDAIPFELQYMLAIEYAVGRVTFGDAAAYERYARSVVAYETAAGALPAAADAVFFATHHERDAATELSSGSLVAPLLDGDGAGPTALTGSKFRGARLLAGEATRAALQGVLHGKAAPSLIFTATHGMGFPSGHAQQAREQGALLCQDWTGLGTIDRSHYLAAADVDDDARVHGAIAFHFACFGAGTPKVEDFAFDAKQPPQLAPAPFCAALPQRLLSHPRGGALAVLGHVDRAFACSIAPIGVGPYVSPFRNVIMRLVRGRRVGTAMQDFPMRYALLSTMLLGMIHKAATPAREIASRFLERTDAQNYVCLGDPAVRLRVADLA